MQDEKYHDIILPEERRSGSPQNGLQNKCSILEQKKRPSCDGLFFLTSFRPDHHPPPNYRPHRPQKFRRRRRAQGADRTKNGVNNCRPSEPPNTRMNYFIYFSLYPVYCKVTFVTFYP